MTTQTALPIGEDFCTVAYAAELANVSQRTIRRLLNPGKDNAAPTLRRVQPKCGSQENGRRHTLLYTAEVRDYVAARRLVRP